MTRNLDSSSAKSGASSLLRSTTAPDTGALKVESLRRRALKRLILSLTLCCCAFSTIAVSGAEAQSTIALGSFEGPGADDVRQALHDNLAEEGGQLASLASSVGNSPAEVASAAGADIVLIGEVIRRGRQWRGRVRVFDAQGNETGEATGRSTGSAGLAAALAREVQPHLPQMSVLDGTTLRILFRGVSGSGASQAEEALLSVLQADGNVQVVREQSASEAAELLGLDLDAPGALARVGEELGLVGFIEGRMARGRRRRSLQVRVVNIETGEETGRTAFQGRNVRGIVSSVERRGNSRLIPLLAELAPRQTQTGATSDPDEGSTQESSGGSSATSDGGGIRPDFRPGGGDLPVAFEAWVGGTALRRTLDWHQDITEQSTYSTGPTAPEIFVGFRWYPASHVSGGWPSYLGVDVQYRRVFGLSSTRTQVQDENESSDSYETGAQSFHVGVRGRLPLGLHEVSLFLGYGGQSFFVDANQANEAVLDTLPGIPTVNYRFLRVSAEARLALRDFRVSVNAGYDLMLSFGGVESDNWLPLASGGAIEAGGTFGYEFLVGGEESSLEVWLGFDFRRVYVSSNVDGEDGFIDPLIVGGMVDQYFRPSLGVTWRR